MSEAADSSPRRVAVRPAAPPRPYRPTDAELERGVYPLDPPWEDVRIPVTAPHLAATSHSRLALMHHFPDAEVGEDLHLLFSEPGEAHQSRLAPDVLVALGVPRSVTRRDYDADALGPPDFVLEVLSRSTWRHDVRRKLDCYQRIGVRECVLFDVTGEDLAGTGADLWGFAMTPERRRPLAAATLPDGARGLLSEALGLIAHVSARVPPVAPRDTWALTLRWHDPATGTDLPDYCDLGAIAAERDSIAAERGAIATERDSIAAERDAIAAERDAAQRRIAELEATLRGER